MVVQDQEMEMTRALVVVVKRHQNVEIASLEPSVMKTLRIHSACVTSSAMATMTTRCVAAMASPTTRRATSERRPASNSSRLTSNMWDAAKIKAGRTTASRSNQTSMLCPSLARGTVLWTVPPPVLMTMSTSVNMASVR
ncbi:hypothetical protein INR49_025829 [Caranx melampygus]|nr:hypothetical protein INR49_025829 [Caranx melampygus]